MKKLILGFALAFAIGAVLTAQMANAAPRLAKGASSNFSNGRGNSIESTCSIWCSNGRSIEITGDIGFFECWDICESFCGGPCSPV
ncbi:MAG TPA: hypothetical protein PK413_06080 [Thermoanaerobaculia bacterium]|nr:hypothetical protein [Thermoanaerobaculia bacterium]